MRLEWLRILTAAGGLAGLAAGGCQHAPPKPDPVPPVVATGTVDCASPSVWQTTTFAGLVPGVQSAVADSNPQQALGGLLQSHSASEVTCVVGFVHGQSAAQAAAAPGDPLPAQRVAATEAWLQQESSKGLTVVNDYKGGGADARVRALR
jgi:hypothetical protein